jgi:septum site-determining protein MinC
MLHEITEVRTAALPIRLRRRGYSLLTLEIADLPPIELAQRLAEKIECAPGFFWQLPVILDLSALPAQATGKVGVVIETVRSMGLAPAGFLAQRPDIRKAALAAGLGAAAENDAAGFDEAADGAVRRPALIVNEPVRSGQRIYAAGADLVVLRSVSAGAELLADGCIHVYGTLRGAAFAGVSDDPLARIFAKNMHAEKVAIAGLFLNAKEYPEDPAGRATQVRIIDGMLRLEPLP